MNFPRNPNVDPTEVVCIWKLSPSLCSSPINVAAGLLSVGHWRWISQEHSSDVSVCGCATVAVRSHNSHDIHCTRHVLVISTTHRIEHDRSIHQHVSEDTNVCASCLIVLPIDLNINITALVPNSHECYCQWYDWGDWQRLTHAFIIHQFASTKDQQWFWDSLFRHRQHWYFCDLQWDSHQSSPILQGLSQWLPYLNCTVLPPYFYRDGHQNHSAHKIIQYKIIAGHVRSCSLRFLVIYTPAN